MNYTTAGLSEGPTAKHKEPRPRLEDQRDLGVERIDVSELFCPFAPAVNAHAETIQKETAQWASSFGLMSQEWSRGAYDTAAAGLAARTRPAAPREELRLTSDLYTWMFLQDDLRDNSELGRRPGYLSDDGARYLRVLGGEDPTNRDGPLVHALGDLMQRLRARASSPIWVRRFARAVGEYLDATIWEASNRARGTVPDITAYVEMRPLTAGLRIDDELIGLGEDTRFPPEVGEHRSVRGLRRASANAVCWTNDLLSLEKELACGDMHNLILVLARAENLELREAVRRTVQMHNTEVHAFVEIAADLPSFGAPVDANLSRYVAALAARMRGNLDWACESERYRRIGIAAGISAGAA
jgi:5-epi-alpha-selinene synthase